MKKRWIILSIVAFLLTGVVFAMGRVNQPISVSAVTLEPCRVEQKVSCKGMVEVAQTTMVALPMDCVIQQIHVKVGDRVKEDEVIATVDKDATRELVFNSARIAALAALPEQITAPCDGTVLEVSAVTQQVLEQGVPCVMMAADRDVQIRVAIREKDLRSVKQGMEVRITGEGFEKAFYEGKLHKISSTAETDESGTVVEGVVTLSKDIFDPSLRLGLTAKAMIITSVMEDGYVVPYEAVRSDAEGTYVYVLQNGQAQRTAITVAAQVAEGMLLRDASLAKEQVIRDAQHISASGQRVVLKGEGG